MKKLLLFPSLLFSLCLSAQEVIPNGGFELWDSSQVINGEKVIVPEDWQTSNAYMTEIGFTQPVERTTDAHSGESAVKITSMIDDNLTPVSTITSGKDFVNMQTYAGEKFALKRKIQSFGGYYKYLPGNPNDSFIVMMAFYVGGQYAGRAFATGKNEHTTYTPFNLEITYFPNAPVPDSAKLIILPTDPNANNIGSVLYLDDLGVDFYDPTGIKERTDKQASVYIFPNPATRTLHFSDLPVGSAQYEIYDKSGRLMMHDVVKENGIDVEALSPGIYLLLVKDRNGLNAQARFVKQ